MIYTENVSKLISEVREKSPLIHNITNYVTVNDCANVVLAIGASPIMADDIMEAESITSISSALVINIGTLNERTIKSMLASGSKANECNIPVVFDPVGAGASSFRNDTTKQILNNVKVDIIRGNLSELSYIAGISSTTKGVDASDEDLKNDSVHVAKSVATKYKCIVAITGAIDVITDGEKVVKISNGHKLLSRVTGTGCMTSALVGSFAGVTTNYFDACVAGVLSMCLAGEIAYKVAGNIGTGSFHIAIIDALSRINSNDIKELANINEE